MAKKFKLKKKLTKKKLMKKPRSGCAARDRALGESSHIGKFIRAIAQKKYNNANKYLADVIESKLMTRIAATL